MSRILWKTLVLLCAFWVLITNFNSYAYAESSEAESDEIMHYEALMKAADRKEMTFDEKQWLFGDGDKMTGIPTKTETEMFRKGSAAFSFGCDLSLIAEEHRAALELDIYAIFVLYEDAGKFYTCEFSVLENPVIFSDEIKKSARPGLQGITREHGGTAKSDQNQEWVLPEITGIQIFELTYYNHSRELNNMPSDYVAILNSLPFITKFSVIDVSQNGWTEYMHDYWNAEPEEREQTDCFYVRKDGALATQSMTIGGDRKSVV